MSTCQIINNNDDFLESDVDLIDPYVDLSEKCDVTCMSSIGRGHICVLNFVTREKESS